MLGLQVWFMCAEPFRATFRALVFSAVLGLEYTQSNPLFSFFLKKAAHGSFLRCGPNICFGGNTENHTKQMSVETDSENPHLVWSEMAVRTKTKRPCLFGIYLAVWAIGVCIPHLAYASGECGEYHPPKILGISHKLKQIAVVYKEDHCDLEKDDYDTITNVRMIDRMGKALKSFDCEASLSEAEREVPKGKSCKSRLLRFLRKGRFRIWGKSLKSPNDACTLKHQVKTRELMFPPRTGYRMALFLESKNGELWKKSIEHGNQVESYWSAELGILLIQYSTVQDHHTTKSYVSDFLFLRADKLKGMALCFPKKTASPKTTRAKETLSIKTSPKKRSIKKQDLFAYGIFAMIVLYMLFSGYRRFFR